MARPEANSAGPLTQFAGQQDSGAQQHLLGHHRGELSRDTNRGASGEQRGQQRVIS